jgi:spore coat polysaccharide biosynthesis predicted glycosyltransferase SpsG
MWTGPDLASRGSMTARIRLVASAGPDIGHGHLARALSLAEAQWVPDCELELALLDGSFTAAQRARLDAAGAEIVDPNTSPAPDTVVVVDVSDPNRIAARFQPARIAVFDDREAFRGRAALVIQPSLPVWRGRAAAGAVLAGFEFAPISRAIRIRRTSSVTADAAAPGSPRRLLVCFGGSDPSRVTERLVVAIARDVDALTEVIIGAAYAGPTEGWPMRPYRDPPDLVERLATADLVLLGAGTMKFEAACLGRPMLLLAAADDQRPVGPAFASTGAARYIGDGRTVDPGAVSDAVQTLLGDAPALADLGATAARVVDGAGGDRIARAVSRLAQAAGSS